MKSISKMKRSDCAKWLFTTLAGLGIAAVAGCSTHGDSERGAMMIDDSSLRIAPPFPHEQSDVAVDENVVFGTLPSGLRYAILPHAEPPQRVSVRLLVQAGSLMETEQQRGLAHFLEHMAFNGTRHYPPGELVDYLQRMGLGFGADTNAHTGFNETVYKLDMPSNDAQSLDTALTIMRDYADGLLLVPEEIDRERGVILSEKRDRDSIGYRNFVASWNFLFPDTLLPQRLPIGESEVIANATRQDFVDFYAAWYRPERMALVVVGDVDADAVRKEIENVFSGIGAMGAALPEPDLGRIAAAGLAVGNHYEAEASATEVSIANIVADRDSPDSLAVRERVVREAVVNSILSRRLERLAQQPEAPFSEGAFYRYSYLDFFTLCGVQLTCRADQWEAALAVAEQTLRQALEYGFEAAEIEEVAADILKSLAAQVREQDTRKSADISNALVSSLSNKDVFIAPQTALAIARSALEGFDPQAALATLQAMWSDPNRWVFVSGNAQIEEPQQAIGAAYQLAAAATVTALDARAAVIWAHTDFGAAGEIVENSHFEPLQIEQAKFANNVRLNFKHTDFQRGKVLVNVSIAGGMLALPEAHPALASWAELGLLRGGLEDLSWVQLQSLLAGKEVSIDFAVDSDSFAFVGATNAEDFLLQLQLLAAYVTAPGYRPEGAQAAQREFEQISLAAKNTLMGMFRDEGMRFLAGGSYRFGLPTAEAFAAESLQGVQQWLQSPLAEGYLEVSVVGDIDYKSVQQAVAQTFGALPQRAAAAPDFAQAQVSVAFPQAVHEKTLHYAADEEQALALVAWPTVDMSDIGVVRRLSLLSSVVNDRLRLQIRQKLGEGYSPYAFNRSSHTYKGYGYLAALNGVKPASAQEIGTLIRAIGEEIAKGPITEDEFKRALEPQLNFIQEYRRNNAYWLGTVLANSQRYPRQLQWAENFEADVASITVEQLQALAREYLTPQRATILRILPSETQAE